LCSQILKYKQVHNKNIEINHQKVEECKITTFLWVIIDSNKWKPHIQNVCGKLSKCMGILSKVKHVLPRSSMVSLYYTPAYPYLTYFITLKYGDVYNNLNWPN
jgi:hypothetical protein